MRRALLYLGVVLMVGASLATLWFVSHSRVFAVPAARSYRNNWNPRAAAEYLDVREAWWERWPAAQLDHGTFCISCHTALTYALARPALRKQLGQTELTPGEKDLLNNVEKRVSNWPAMKPYYTDPEDAIPSHNTEAVLNAFILANYSQGQPSLGPITRRAFKNAWALQETEGENAGGWKWQNFHEAPWESTESAYQGAAMMALAAGMRPDLYASDPEAQEHVEQLRGYLLRKYAVQPPINQLYVLWASSQMPGLLSEVQRSDLIERIANLQRSDGGWSLSSLDKQVAFKRRVLSFVKRASGADVSDGCATGLTILALEAAGMDSQDPILKRGRDWLEANQRPEGSWWASSLNGFRDQSSGMGHFMSDAATGYAVLALEQAPVR
ncbi:MAG TPA: hypothetical protein VGG45_13415 [Terracidiphilus sp.]|jgi:hypothetical protein